MVVLSKNPESVNAYYKLTPREWLRIFCGFVIEHLPKKEISMLCNYCKKNEATIHYRKVVNGKESELYLCEECAEGEDIFPLEDNKMQLSLALINLLGGLCDLKGESESPKIGKKIEITCPVCGLTYPDLRKDGRLGCPECYITFEEVLSELIRKIHGDTQHRGKVPKILRGQAKLYKLRADLQGLNAQLQTAIKTEAYEEAAKLRDKIRQIEKELTEEIAV